MKQIFLICCFLATNLAIAGQYKVTGVHSVERRSSVSSNCSKAAQDAKIKADQLCQKSNYESHENGKYGECKVSTWFGKGKAKVKYSFDCV